MRVLSPWSFVIVLYHCFNLARTFSLLPFCIASFLAFDLLSKCTGESLAAHLPKEAPQSAQMSMRLESPICKRLQKDPLRCLLR